MAVKVFAEMQKRCGKRRNWAPGDPGCGKLLPLTTFHRSPRNADGRATFCPECSNAMLARARAEKRGRQRPGLPKGAKAEARELEVAGLRRCTRCTLVMPLRLFAVRGPNEIGVENRPYRAQCSRCYCRKQTEAVYKMLEGQFDVLLVAQAGRCGNSGCNRPFDERALGDAMGRVVVDHAHLASESAARDRRRALPIGPVRGLLCYGCNIAATRQNSPEVLRGLADWVEHAGPNKRRSALDAVRGLARG